MKKVLNILLYLILAFAFIFVVFRLFFPVYSSYVEKYMKSLFLPEGQDVVYIEDISILYPEENIDLNPYSNLASTRFVLANTYEPLLQFDRNFNIRPAIALTWGRRNEMTWEFTLRRNLKFHDGEVLDVDDVLYSLNQAWKSENSNLHELFASIDKIEKEDDRTFIITTLKPDPLLSSKLTKVFIVKDGYDFSVGGAIVGTGPYVLKEKLDSSIEFLGFADYWGGVPNYEKVFMYFEEDKNQRIDFMFKESIDFMAFLPQDAVTAVKQFAYEVSGVPSLENQFLLLNFESNVFKNFENRVLFNKLIDKLNLARKLGIYVKPQTQLVSNGVFGYNLNIEDLYVEAVSEKYELVNESLLGDESVKIVLPEGLSVLGEFLRNEFQTYDIDVFVSYLQGDNFQKALLEKDFDMVFLGFKSDYADAQEIFDSLFYSDSNLNFSSYYNADLDSLLDSARHTFNLEKRLELLKQAMEVVVIEDVAAIPLIEYDFLFAYKSVFDFSPRLDALVFFDDIKQKL